MDDAVWIGEDGDACVSCDTKEQALEKVNKLIKECIGDDEPLAKIEDIGIGYLFLVDKGEKKYFDDDIEWFIDISKVSNYQIWVYSPN